MNLIGALAPTIKQPENAKAVHAAANFEAVLLNAVFGDLQATFTDLPGKSLSNSTKAYDGIAMQALTSGLSQGGGIGLGAFVGRWLAARKQHVNGV